MHTHIWKKRPASPARAVPGKHARGASHSHPQGRTARRILITGLLLGSLAAGSAAIFQSATATGSVSAHHQAATSTVDSPWMY
jgi:hypothetical protein